MVDDPWWRAAVAVTTAIVCDERARARARNACRTIDGMWEARGALRSRGSVAPRRCDRVLRRDHRSPGPDRQRPGLHVMRSRHTSTATSHADVALPTTCSTTTETIDRGGDMTRPEGDDRDGARRRTQPHARSRRAVQRRGAGEGAVEDHVPARLGPRPLRELRGAVAPPRRSAGTTQPTRCSTTSTTRSNTRDGSVRRCRCSARRRRARTCTTCADGRWMCSRRSSSTTERTLARRRLRLRHGRPARAHARRDDARDDPAHAGSPVSAGRRSAGGGRTCAAGHGVRRRGSVRDGDERRAVGVRQRTPSAHRRRRRLLHRPSRR